MQRPVNEGFAEAEDIHRGSGLDAISRGKWLTDGQRGLRACYVSPVVEERKETSTYPSCPTTPVSAVIPRAASASTNGAPNLILMAGGGGSD